MSEPTQDLIPVEPVKTVRLIPAAEIPADAMAVFGSADRPYYCSFDQTTPEGITLLDKCETEPDTRVSALINMEISLRDVYAHKVPYVTEEGEEIELTRICLITTDQRVLACASGGIAKSILRLIRQHKAPPWKAGIKVRVNQREKDGRRWFDLTNVPSAITEPDKRARRPQ